MWTWLVSLALGQLINKGKAVLRDLPVPISLTLGATMLTTAGAVGAKVLQQQVGSDDGKTLRLYVFLVKE